jgi:membrane protease YdiL (CAAX protease family)
MLVNDSENINSNEKQMNLTDLKNKKESRLSQHPWISLVVLVVLMVSLYLASKFLIQRIELVGYEINPIIETTFGTIVGIILFFGIVPFVLGLPHERTSLNNYLSAIRLQRPKSFYKLAIVTMPCIIILFSSWLLASFIYNQIFLDGDLAFFLTQLMDTSRALPPKNWSIVTATGSIFEEVLLRGIFLTMLLKRYTERKSIVLSAAAFGGIHILNLMNGPPTTELFIGVFAQILFATSYGLFYGYLFIKTQNLIPCMIMHYVGNGFISFFWYTPNAPFLVYMILMLVFYIGLFPTALSIAWVNYSSNFQIRAQGWM